MDARLPAHLEISGIIRAVQAEGGFATVLSKGERDAGTIMIVTLDRGGPARLYERMPQIDGSRPFVLSREQDADNPMEFNEFLRKRGAQDPDLWVLELDIADPERFAALQHKSG
ncbi:DUF1491 family protein [Pontixanthobacter aestiaquae]|uniref:DUF1491 family protein n=1 Tax=Pontixanthobacter aestiaquae TaxID=1509367 RepID=A0A844Z350_9SPHN|nr:DUF1491 family protein [Pontixanthobacter aestiaquae]MDN3646880.1 DUF1491 family protein [Pontixanthobacter aestiaquae]MXO82138.1 DUF1491 family protein [Pontixanthobacter aestiaquae]